MGTVIDQLRQTMALLLEPPIPLASAWVAWLAFGLVLAFWYNRAKAAAAAMEESLNRPLPRSKSGVRPPAKPQPKPDAFEELQSLLDGNSTVQS
jgi:hypothetical protein